MIYQRNAALQLEALTNAATNGHFGAAMRMYETLSFVPYIFQTASCRCWPAPSSTTDAMQATARRSFDLILLAALPIGVGVTLLAPQIIESDRRGAPTMPGRSCRCDPGAEPLPLYADMILATILISADKQRAWGSVAVLAALINPLLNWWLIPITDRELQQRGYRRGRGDAVHRGADLLLLYLHGPARRAGSQQSAHGGRKWRWPRWGWAGRSGCCCRSYKRSRRAAAAASWARG